MTLAADPSTPIYACGSTPNRMRCKADPPADFTADRNLVAPSYADTLAVGDLVATFLGSRPGVPVIGICTWPGGCDMAAVDGRCLLHG